MINEEKSILNEAYSVFSGTMTGSVATLGAKLGTTSEDGLTISFEFGDFEVENGENLTTIGFTRRPKYALAEIALMEFDRTALETALPMIDVVGNGYSLKSGAYKLHELTECFIFAPSEDPDNKSRWIIFPKAVNVGSPSFEFGPEVVTVIGLELRTFQNASKYHVLFGNTGNVGV
ncbi:hypothetical protein ACIQVU_07970 [Lysinibacillus sp. NPDC098008]|uniref:hypothetical protein n=1 Tax=Lysinibacillus sp. NPDC098008 TaxID=3364146 RepID=UPI003805CE19